MLVINVPLDVSAVIKVSRKVLSEDAVEICFNVIGPGSVTPADAGPSI